MNNLPPVPEPGYLVLGRTPDNTHVVINHPKLQPDANGVGHIVFTPNEARGLANMLLKLADLCEPQLRDGILQ